PRRLSNLAETELPLRHERFECRLDRARVPAGNRAEPLGELEEERARLRLQELATGLRVDRNGVGQIVGGEIHELGERLCTLTKRRHHLRDPVVGVAPVSARFEEGLYVSH